MVIDGTVVLTAVVEVAAIVVVSSTVVVVVASVVVDVATTVVDGTECDVAADLTDDEHDASTATPTAVAKHRCPILVTSSPDLVLDPNRSPGIVQTYRS
ncbi:MAG TPA: hypothetical protein VGM78_14090, partial [Ilumatobacteraceae bacterium]